MTFPTTTLRSWPVVVLAPATLLVVGCASVPPRANTTAARVVPTVPAAHAEPRPGPGYTPHRVYDVAADRFIDFETLVTRAAAADIVFFGERHGHVPGHRMQHALLESLARRGSATLSLEMFERDVQHVVDAYLAGTVDHPAFLAGSRPWSRYFPDYHPLVETARAHDWNVVAANLPRQLAAGIAQDGLDVLATLDAAHRALAAADMVCPDDDYRARFVREMSRHPSADASSDADGELVRQQRYYEAQCARDETMAESIAGAAARGATRPIVHVTGAFHSDHGDGIPSRLLRRMPELKIVSLTSVPVADLDAADPAPHLQRADYLLFTLDEPPIEKPH